MFVFPAGTMFFPLNTGSIMLCASSKSLPQPRFGQIATFDFGTSQNLESIVSCGTSLKVSLMPIWPNCDWIASAVLDAGAELSAIVSSGGPVYVPLENPAFFMYDL